MCCSPASAASEFTYELSSTGDATITGFIRAAAARVEIPDQLDGHPVTGIADGAFADMTSLASIRISGRITAISPHAFGDIKPSVEAYNGAQALAYAAANDLPYTNLSSLDFLPDVIDLTDTDWSYDGALCLQPADAARLSVGDSVYPGRPIGDDVERVYRLSSLERSGDIWRANIEELEGIDALGSFSAHIEDEYLSILNVTPAAGVSVQSITPGSQPNEMKIALKYDINDNLSMNITVTYSARMTADYSYENKALPTGYMMLTETMTVKGSATIKAGVGMGSKFTMMEIPAVRSFASSDDSLLSMNLGGGSLFSVKGNVSLKLSASLAGEIDYACTKVKGLYINGNDATVVNEVVTEKCKNFEVSGSVSLGLSSSIGLNVKGFGTIVSMAVNVGISAETSKSDQYDPEITCYDVPLSLKGDISFIVKLAVTAKDILPLGEALTFELAEKKLKLVEFAYEIARAHIESHTARIEGTNLPTHALRFMRSCSISESTKKTFRFHTGTTVKVEDQFAVVGNKIKKPAALADLSERNTFVGWYTELEEGEPFDFTAPITAEAKRTTTIYAHWSLPYRKLTVDYDYPGYEDIVTIVPPDTYIANPVVPLRMDYHFEGFYYAMPSTTGYIEDIWDFNTMTMPDRDLVVTGRWRYEEGYNPYQDLIDAYSGEEVMSGMLDHIVLSPSNTTAMLALFMREGISDERLNTVANYVYHVTGYEGSFPVVNIPPLVNGYPVLYVDGTNFQNKDYLVGLILPPTVLSITGFDDFPNLQFISFGEGPESWTGNNDIELLFEGIGVIQADAIKNCPSLSMVTMPPSLRAIGRRGFQGTAVTSLNLQNVEKLGKSSLSGNSKLTQVQLGESLKALPDYVLADCVSLGTINLDYITVYGEGALQNTGFKQLEVSNVESVGTLAFADCANLEELTINMKEGFALDGFIFGNTYPALKHLTINGDVASTFSLYGSSTSLTMLESVTINGDVNGSLALSVMPNLKRINVSGNVYSVSLKELPLLTELNIGSVIKKSGDISGNPSLALVNCPMLNTFDFSVLETGTSLWIDGGGFTHLNLDAFASKHFYLRNMPELVSVILPQTATVIVNNAFENCTALREIVIPPSVTEIGAYAFMGCTSLERFTLPGPTVACSADIFYGCTALTRSLLPSSYETYDLTHSPLNSAPCLSRITFESADTTFTGDYDYINLFVLICPENGAAWNAAQRSSDPYCLIPSGSSAENKWVVRFMSGGLVSDSAAYGASTTDMIYKLFSAGEAICLPDMVSYIKDDGTLFTGWYYDEACTMPVPADATMPSRDITLYGSWVNQTSDFTYSVADGSATITGYTGTSTKIAVPERIDGFLITAIAGGAFGGVSPTEIHLPKSIETLDPALFADYDALQHINIQSDRFYSVDGIVYANATGSTPESLIICPRGFAGVLSVADGVTHIRDGAAANCGGLTGIAFSAELTQIGVRAFAGCTALTSVSFPESLLAIDSAAFAGCTVITQVTFAADAALGLSAIPANAGINMVGPVGDCALRTWADENGIAYNEYALTLQDGSASRTFMVQAGSPLSSYALTNTNNQVFAGWAVDLSSKIPTYINVMPADDMHLYAVWENLFTITDDVLVSIHAVAGKVVDLPSGITQIASGACSYALTQITIPASVTVIDDGAFTAVSRICGDAGSAAQAYALAKGIPFEQKIYTLVFHSGEGTPCEPISGVSGVSITLPTPVRSQANFLGWYEDEALTVQLNCTEMVARDCILWAKWQLMPGYEMDFAFAYNTDGTITVNGYSGANHYPELPATINGRAVTAIAPAAFSYDNILQYLDIPASVKTVGAGAFANSSLRGVTFLGADLTLGAGAFENCAALTSLALPAKLTAIPARLLYGCDSLVKLSLPGTVAAIGDSAFSGCRFIEQLELPAGLQQFSLGSLSGLQLTDITVSSGSTRYTAAGSALYSADGATLLYLCRNTDATAFAVPSGVRIIADGALQGCSRIRTLTLPDGLIEIGEYALSGLSLSELTLPQSLTHIGAHALTSSPLLSTLHIPSGVTYIGDDTFDKNSDIALYVPDSKCYAYTRLSGLYNVIASTVSVDVTGIALSNSSLSMMVGDTAALTATLTPANATNTKVTWHSLSSAIASVDGGVITAHSAGRTVVYATTASGQVAICNVTVGEQTASAYVVDPSYLTDDGVAYIFYNMTYVVDYASTSSRPINNVELSAPSGNIRISGDQFSISDEVWTYDGDAYELELLISYADGTKAYSVLKLVACMPPDRPVLPTRYEMFVGDTYRIPGFSDSEYALDQIYPGLHGTDDTVAVISPGGYIQAIAPGHTVLYYENCYGAQFTILEVKAPACELTISMDNDHLFIGESQSPTVYCSDESMTLLYTSTASAIASYESGVAKANTSGTAGLTVKAVRDGVTCAQATLYIHCYKSITWFDPLNVIEYNYDADVYTIEIGKTINLMDSSMPSDADNASVLWTSSDESLLTIDKNGLATAKGCGKVTITGTMLYDGTTKTVDAVIDNWTGDPYVLSTETTLAEGDSLALETAILPTNTNLTLNYVIEDSSKDILSIDENGYMTGLQQGNADYYVQTINSGGYVVEKSYYTMRVVAGNNATSLLDMPEEITVAAGSYTRIAMADPIGSNLYNISYQLDDNKIAYMMTSSSSSGASIGVHGLKPGTTTLTVTLYGGKTYTCLVRVVIPELYAQIKQLSDYYTARLCVGDSYQMEAINITCANAYTLEWATRNDVLSISDKGVVKALKAGSGTVTLTITDTKTQANMRLHEEIQVIGPVSGIKAPTSAVCLAEYNWGTNQIRIPLELLDASGDPSSTANRASVTCSAGAKNEQYWTGMWSAPDISYGSLSGMDEPCVYLSMNIVECEPIDVTITIDNGIARTDTCTFTIYPTTDTTTAITMDDVIAPIGYTGQLGVAYETSDGNDDDLLLIDWSIDDQSVASITSGGVLHVKSAGTTTLHASATTYQGSALTCSARLTVPSDQLTALTLVQTTLDIPCGETAALSWTAEPDDGRLITFSSSDPTVATADVWGNITALSPGKTVITASGGGKVKATCDVTVLPVALDIKLNVDDEFRLPLGEQYQLSVTFTPDDACDKTLTWHALETDVITIDENGLATAVGEGYANVYVNAGDLNDQTVIFVYKPIGEITPNVSSGTLRRGGQLQLSVTDKRDAPLHNRNLLWSSSSPDVMSVSTTGVVTALGEGVATITVATRDGSGRATISVICRGQSQTLNLPKSLQIIDEEAFAGMVFFDRVVLGADVIAVMDRAFAGCTSLDTIVVTNPNTTLAQTAFDLCASGFTVYCDEGSAVWAQATGYGWNVKAR